MSRGRHRWRSSRESPTLSLVDSSGVDKTVCSFDIYMHVDIPVLPLAFSSSRRLPSSATRRVVKRMLLRRIANGLCFAIDTPNTYRHPPSSSPPPLRRCHHLPLPAPFLHQSQALNSQTLELDFVTDKSQWVIRIIIQSQVHLS